MSVYLEVAIGGVSCGKIFIRLNDHQQPITCANFRALCTGEKGLGKTTGKPLHYLNTPFHRVIPGFMIQCGDFSKKNGTGGESIYGGNGKFKDENLRIGSHKRAGTLSMANSGPNSNGSQFFITLAPTPHLDGKHCVFGEVYMGMDIVQKIEVVDTDHANKPVFGNDCIIIGCGLADDLKEKEKKKEKKSVEPTPKRSSGVGAKSANAGIMDSEDSRSSHSSHSSDSDSSDDRDDRDDRDDKKKQKKHEKKEKKKRKKEAKKEKKREKKEKKREKKESKKQKKRKREADDSSSEDSDDDKRSRLASPSDTTEGN